jgi:hypothetical protein
MHLVRRTRGEGGCWSLLLLRVQRRGGGIVVERCLIRGFVTGNASFVILQGQEIARGKLILRLWGDGRRSVEICFMLQRWWGGM